VSLRIKSLDSSFRWDDGEAGLPLTEATWVRAISEHLDGQIVTTGRLLVISGHCTRKPFGRPNFVAACMH
jgi:hypothetical protein